jgi:orotate phosphoribosyltransferase-like protein
MKNNELYSSYLEEVIIQYWLKGFIREEIAKEFHLSTVTASNVWAKSRNKLVHYEADALRELGKQLRRQNMTAENCAIGLRMSKIIEKLGIPKAKIKEFLCTIYEISQKMVSIQRLLKML